MPHPTPKDLIQRLREVTGANTEMDLAIELGVSIRTIQSWKAGKGISFPYTMMALERAGWLNVDGPEVKNRATAQQAQQLARRLVEVAEELEGLFR